MTTTGLSPHRSTKIVVLDDYQSVAGSMADWHGTRHPLELDFINEHITNPEELIGRLKDAEIVVAMRERTPLPAAVLNQLPQLRLIVTTGMHNASIDMTAGPTVCGTPALSTPTVEMTWALIMGLARNLCSEAASLRAGTWQQSVGEGLAGSTLGLLGLGKIGSRVAKVGQAFGMRTIAWSQNLDTATAEDNGVQRVSSDELFEEADFLSIHLRLSSRTTALVNEDRLRAMKTSARLINTSRAAIVDQQALIRALDEGWIAAAGLDVYDHEPIPASHPLLALPNVLLTPHLGYVVRQNYEGFYRDALEDIVAYLDGNPIRVLSHNQTP